MNGGDRSAPHPSCCKSVYIFRSGGRRWSFKAVLSENIITRDTCMLTIHLRIFSPDFDFASVLQIRLQLVQTSSNVWSNFHRNIYRPLVLAEYLNKIHLKSKQRKSS